MERAGVKHPTSNVVSIAIGVALWLGGACFGWAAEQASVIVASGVGGNDEYAGTFEKWTADWNAAAATASAQCATAADLASLQQAVQAQPRETPAPLWLVLIGHGTFDGRDGKFNLRGDDLAASTLAEWLRPFKRPLVIVCGFSASGSFLKALSGPDRVIVTATKSGSESNFARFGGYFAAAIGDPAADFDKDGQTSVLEAWLAASEQSRRSTRTKAVSPPSTRCSTTTATASARRRIGSQARDS